jgi:cupin 2 domain-containing protein
VDRSPIIPEVKNLFSPLGSQGGPEIFEKILIMHEVRLERIFSHGCPTPPGEWYDQAWQEWVVLLRGTAVLQFDDGTECCLAAGDFLTIAPHQRHRVESVSNDAVWLALHFG